MQRRRRGFIERLEPRHLMAGHLTATLQGANLVIEGDDLANTLAISSSAPARVILRGFAPDERITDITTINLFSNTVQFENVTGAIIVRMRGGDDRLFLTGGSFLGPLTVDLGIGNDRAEIGRDTLRLLSSFNAQLGLGDDVYLQTGTSVLQYQSIAGGPGGDVITVIASSVGGGFSINGDAGFDGIRVERTSVGSFTGITGGDDGDRIEAVFSAFAAGVSILGGAGGDLVELVGSRFSTTLFVALEADFGAVTVRGSIVAGDCWLTSAGRGNITFQSSRANRLEIASGPSSDTVIVDRSALDMLFVRLGEGNDVLRVTGNEIARGGLFDGQGGIDTLFERVMTVGAQRLGFENVDIM
jgi:hypothetical protein